VMGARLRTCRTYRRRSVSGSGVTAGFASRGGSRRPDRSAVGGGGEDLVGERLPVPCVVHGGGGVEAGRGLVRGVVRVAFLLRALLRELARFVQESDDALQALFDVAQHARGVAELLRRD